MIQCRQPARRRDWARAGLLSTLALLPLAALNPVPRIDLRGTIHALLSIDLDDPSPWPSASSGDDLEPRHPATPGRAIAPDGPGGLACPPGQPAGSGKSPEGWSWPIWPGPRSGSAGSRWGFAARPGWSAEADLPRIRWLRHYQSLPFEGGSRRPRLLVSDRATRPVLVGSLRPAILIPPGLDQPEASDRLRLSLSHELAHAESLDHQFGPAATLAQAIWFFLPPVWWIRDQMKLDQEFLADRRAVEHFGTSGGYASSLVDLASLPASRSSTGKGDIAPDRNASSCRAEGGLRTLPARDDAGEMPVRDRRANSPLVAMVDRDDDRPDHAGGLLPDAPRARRLVELDELHGRRTRGRPVDPAPATGDQPSRARRPAIRPPVPAARPLLIDLRGDGRAGRPAEHRSARPQARRRSRGRPQPDSLPPLASRADHPRHGLETVEVDDRPLAIEPTSAKLAPWLTIRPSPGQTTRIRDLELLKWTQIIGLTRIFPAAIIIHIPIEEKTRGSYSLGCCSWHSWTLDVVGFPTPYTVNRIHIWFHCKYTVRGN